MVKHDKEIMALIKKITVQYQKVLNKFDNSKNFRRNK